MNKRMKRGLKRSVSTGRGADVAHERKLELRH
jgi:hypothetical protein